MPPNARLIVDTGAHPDVRAHAAVHVIPDARDHVRAAVSTDVKLTARVVAQAAVLTVAAIRLVNRIKVRVCPVADILSLL